MNLFRGLNSNWFRKESFDPFLVTFPTVFRVDILKREAIPSLHEKYGVENHDAN